MIYATSTGNGLWQVLRSGIACCLWGLYLVPCALQAQGVLIGPGDAPPNGSALLHMDVSGFPAQAKKGMLPPQVALTRTDQPDPVGPLPLPPSLIVFNTATTTLGGNDAQYNVYPGLYAWDGGRWLRMEAGHGQQVYVHCVTNPTPIQLNNLATPTSTTLIAAPATLQHRLVPGDRVMLEASGMFQMTPVGVTNDANRWVTVEVEIFKASPAPLEVLARTYLSFDTRYATGSQTSAIFGFFSSSTAGFQQRSSIQNFNLVALYESTTTDVPVFSVRARKLSNVGVITNIGAGNPCLRSEVWKY